MTTLEAQQEVITNLIVEKQKLERERDEARELAEKWRKESNWIGNEPSYKFPWEAAK